MSVIRVALLGVLLFLSVSPSSSARLAGDKQLVIVSFDGAHDNKLWAKSRAIAEQTGARFTYFLSCTFLMTREQGQAYRAPGQKAGRSNVGFAPSSDDVRRRLDHIWSARGEGHEIASHGCGHFDGKGWSKQQWKTEFAAFSDALKSAWLNVDLSHDEPAGWQDFAGREIAGFRAPYLSTNGNMINALKESGFDYDASGVSRGPVSPAQRGSFSTFDLPLIAEGPRNRRVIAMDYNLFVRHSGGLENSSRSKQFEDRSYRAFRRAFDAEYGGARRPLQIGLHFVEMNAGAYWRAMERLLNDICGLEDVACVSYRDAVDALGLRRDGGGA
jgi:hypothetical protein